MKRRIKYLRHFSVRTKDGKKAKIKDFLFDEKQWKVRYAEVDFGSLFKEKRVLIPRVFLQTPDEGTSLIDIELTKEQIDKFPAPEAHKPVSRQLEEKIHDYYDLKYYWAMDIVPLGGSSAGFFPPRPVKAPEKIVRETDIDTQLRSFKEVKGYSLQAEDGRFGELYDLIVDDTDWQVVWVVIDTEGWLPWSKKVMAAVEHLGEIDYADEDVYMKLKKEKLENAPALKATDWKKNDFEKSAFDYFAWFPGPVK